MTLYSSLCIFDPIKFLNNINYMFVCIDELVNKYNKYSIATDLKWQSFG